MKEKLLISACLLGHNTKYNGKNNKLENITCLEQFFDFIVVCPEVDGGLSIPRLPSEIRNHRVINSDNEDVTSFYESGANKALTLVIKHHIKYALLKDKSPSCGKRTYDGTFTHQIISRPGILVEKLKNINVLVFDENEIDDLIKALNN